MRMIKLAVVATTVVFCIITVSHRSWRVSSQNGSQLKTPTGVVATDDLYNNKVGIYWDAVPFATAYRVLRSSSEDASTASQIGTTAASFFFDNTALPGQPSFYWIIAENASSVSAISGSDRGQRSAAQQQGPVPPLGPPPPAPAGNELTAAKAYLGKALFWDEQLSSTGTVSCGTCHRSSSGGTDPRRGTSAFVEQNPGTDGLGGTPDDIRGSFGVPANEINGAYRFDQTYGFGDQVTGRKSMSYLNAGYSPVLFWDGRATGTYRDPITGAVVLNAGAALESQAAGPPVSSAEMAHTGRNWTDVAAKVALSKPLELSPSVPAALESWIDGRDYPELFAEVFGTPEVTPSKILMAIGTFERTLFTDQTPIDLANAGISPLTAQENRGRNIFNASGCNVCHGGSLLTDNAFHYIGVRPQNEDTGRFQVTGNNGDRGAFRTPSLRNVELRGSFFHNGQFSTLEQVVAFYNRGGDFDAPNKPNVIRPLGLNQQQQADLVAFLRRPLTDPRVQAEAAPFDRPALYADSDRVPRVDGQGRAGSGGVTPAVRAISPPLLGNPAFTMSVSSAMGNSQAVLVIDSSDPGVGSQIPAAGSFARVATTTQNTGAGNGWASVAVAIPDLEALEGQTLFARWYISDPGAENGFSVSQLVSFTLFGEGTVTPTSFSISGTVTTPTGEGLRNTTVVISNESAKVATVITSSFGTFQFDELPAGTYRIGVISRRYRFTPRIITLSTSDVSGLTLAGIE